MKHYFSDSINALRLEQLQKKLQKVKDLGSRMADLSDSQLQRQTIKLKAVLENGASLDEILPEAYATVREASKRVLGLYHKDMQVMGAIILHEGNIPEMQTGEGKTLTATMPLYLNALSGNGVYLITTNDYLAKRDFEEMSPLFEWLGLTTSLGFVDIPEYKYKPNERKMIYSADIIYTTNGRLGFDYLIDNLADSLEGKFLPNLKYGIIDEIDSIILDAAQTPLVISGAPRVQSNLYHIVKEFIETLIFEQHFKVDKTKKEVWLTMQGIEAANEFFNIDHLYSGDYTDLVRSINLALRGHYLYDTNIDYFVFNGEVVLLDKITGRLLQGTKLQSGLHQSIEAKENVEISQDMSVMATITFQNLFKQFSRFSGMTATGKLGEKEFFDLYGKVVIQIPTSKVQQRVDLPDKVFLNSQSKNEAIIREVERLHQSHRPILLITRTAEAAEYFSQQLFEKRIPNNLLIAQNVAKEALMIAEAGQLNTVTVATSMAGRGTDIKLGPGVKELGGLAVIINEHMENGRVDQQLKGRSGRQGDPGDSQVFISLDDYLVKRWSNSKMLENERLFTIDTKKLENSRLFKNKMTKIVKKAQRISEEQGERAREIANEYEKSISIQREFIYKERNKILTAETLNNFDLKALANDVFDNYLTKQRNISKGQYLSFIYKNLSFQFEDDITDFESVSQENLKEYLLVVFGKEMQRIKYNIKSEEKYIEFMQKSMLKAIDNAWIKQVDHLQQLKNSVNNRQNGKRNAMFEYHKVALESFDAMREAISINIIRNLCLSIITHDKDGELVVHFP
ncbi:accessory Sec system translocase SecA2 [Staphylococcus xylosus]|uniref:accessory Sec system translocase SecA2 n=1 Tax=Staphylococcus xylosus TaxID=1288 RepID=UPI0011C99A23|nr:accessory Sec system translocase SecA2 [Staphylococcus xylosus]WRY40333.1 accessory Sec system translocase SecA2 [Staphylococcus xylosus]